MRCAALSRRQRPIGSALPGDRLKLNPLRRNLPRCLARRPDWLYPRTAQRNRVFSAVYLERDFGAQYLVVCSPPLDNAGYPLARRPFSVLRSLISPAARTCPIKHVTLLALAGSVRGEIAPAKTRPLLALRYLRGIPREERRRDAGSSRRRASLGLAWVSCAKPD